MRFLPAAKWIRPVWWGLCVSIGSVALLFTAQLLWHQRIESGWSEFKSARQQNLADLLRSRFNETIAEQRKLAERIHIDLDVRRAFEDRTPVALKAAFERLESFRADQNVSLDVVDSLGNIVLWSGRSIRNTFSGGGVPGDSEEPVFVSQAGLHRFLSVGEASQGRGYTVFVSSPLETNYPLSNRFVSQQSFVDAFQREAGVLLRFESEISSKDTAGETTFPVPIYSKQEKVLTVALISTPTIASEQAKVDRWLDFGIAVGEAVGLLCISLLAAGMFASRGSLGHRRLYLIPIFWSVRIGWKYAGFPSTLGGGFLLDPAVHSSPFPLGLASSLGELAVSAVCVCFTFVVLLQSSHQWYSESKFTNRPRNWHRDGFQLGIALLIPLVFQWVVRAYGASMRSFVFDSTIRYLDPMSLLPGAQIAVMHFSILMLTLALIAAGGAAFIVVARACELLLKTGGSRLGRVALVTAIFLVGYGVYLIIDWPPQLPLSVPLFLFGVSALVLMVVDAGELAPRFLRQFSVGAVACLLAAAFCIAVFALDAKTHEKERERVQILAEELLRPADTWLSFVVSESIRSATSRASDQLTMDAADSVSSVDLAFSLWAQTLMSKEGYSSAVVVYDRMGKELSRFAVGLNSYEQMELLTKLFHKEEDALLVVDRKGMAGTVKFYGQWEQVLDKQVQPVGTVAIVMSASQRALFRGEAPEQLRTSSTSRLEDLARPLAISEYRNGALVSTNDPVLFRGMPLLPGVEYALQNNRGRFVWSDEQVEGRQYEVVYARDESDTTRVLSVSLLALDLRWHLFSIVKALLVYALFLFLVVAVLLVRALVSRVPLKFGFREKLTISFAVLSVLPLLMMAFYDRQLAVARLDDNITGRLSQDLDLIQQRFATDVLNEDDFNSGVTNDFCETIASDLGVDFSVFEGTALKASSRPELYRSSLLDKRLTGTAYANALTLGREFYKSQERIGEISYFVGYRPILIDGAIRGVLAVPALYRQQEIDEELAQRNAFVLGAYAFVVSLVIGVGIVLAHALSKPLRELSKAARSVGRGDLNVVLKAPSADEVGDLIRSFNEMTAELKTSRQNLARAEREMAWKEMAKQVAHEIKNPLTPIKLSVQHLVQAYRQGAKDFGDILQRVSQTVIEQIDVLTRIASEFSRFARMPERKFERLDLNELVTDTVNLFKEVSGIDFKSRLAPQPAIVVADQDELRRVFINIVRNSVQAMENGGTVSIELGVEHKVCRIRISDTGAGIPEDVQAKVFQPNFSTKTDGMGLGLAIAQKVIEDLNGTVTVQSKVGVGTIVEMKIPLRYS
ncbi:MAG: hypothetical protein A2X66_07760 [Ignavibacteria bacterium GWA2_54_16]|nr:MAG: hypothetical protein A2X66_07760 [Ignavibacteria bacterium GWA2_54_16]